MDYYTILGVSNSSDLDTIKKAYYKLAKKYHPDKNIKHKKIAGARFKLISEAYHVLCDPIKKKKYDKQFNKFDSIKYNNLRDCVWKIYNKPDINTIKYLLELNETDVNMLFDQTLTNLCNILITHIPNVRKEVSKDVGKDVSKDVGKDVSKDVSKDISKDVSKDVSKEVSKEKITINKEVICYYSLEDHYLGDYYTNICFNINNKSEYIVVDTRKKQYTKELVFNSPTKVVIYIINIICKSENNDNFYFNNESDLIYTINTNMLAYFNGFKYKLDLFGDMLLLYFDKPYENNWYIYSHKNKKRNINIKFMVKITVPTSNDLNTFQLLNNKNSSDYIEVLKYNILI